MARVPSVDEAGVVERFHEAARVLDAHARHPGRRRGGHDGALETEPGCFGEAPWRLGDLSELAVEPHLTAGNQVGGNRPTRERRRQREADGEVTAWFGEAHPTEGRHVHVAHGSGGSRQPGCLR